MHRQAWMLRLARGAHSLVVVLSTALAGLPGVAVAAATAAGRTPTAFAVSHSGAATYSIPLWTPPGVGEVDLDLALVYSSRAGSGLLGTGWSLAGLSTITRCNRTWAQDGVAGGVSNTPTDRYCLDGQQLKLVSGSHGTAGAVYATEIETFARVVVSGSAGNGPAAFIVTSKNGLIHEYGTTSDSRVHAGDNSTIRTWSLARVRDRNGNSIALTYVNEAQPGAYTNGTHRVSSISYPSTALGTGPFYRVDFSYSLRPASDVPTGYLTGHVVREPYKLDRVSIQAVGGISPIKSYALGYETAPVSGRLRMTSVQECGAASCLQPTTITYQDGESGWKPVIDTGVAASTRKAPLSLDLTGDGVMDLLFPVDVGTDRVGWRILVGTSNGFAAPYDTGIVTPDTTTLIPGSFAGNGRTQFLVTLNGSWHVAGYGSTGFSVANTGLAPSGEYSAADVDGDGLADLVSQTSGTTPTIGVRRNTSTPVSGALAVQFAATAQTVWSVPNTRQWLTWNNLRVADINGDGRADIVALTLQNLPRRISHFATVLLSNGFGSAFTIGVETTLDPQSMVAMGDWNADGCSDILQVDRIFVSNCAGAFTSIPTGSIPLTGSGWSAALPADWNSDGRTDLLYIDAATRRWFVVPSTGAGAATPVNTGIQAPTTTAWFDIDADGDGLTDLAYRDGNHGNRLRYHLHAGTTSPADLATSFRDGFGLRQNPSYVSIARSHYSPYSNAVFPAVDYQGPLYVVSEFSADDGMGGTYRNLFRYEGAQVNLQGRGFQGFAAQRIDDSRSGLITYDFVARDFPYTGMHTQRSSLQANGTLPVRQWKAELGTQAIGGAGVEQRRLPLVTSTTDQHFEVGGTLIGKPVTEALVEFTYGDGHGNPTLVRQSAWDRDPVSPYLNSVTQSTTSLAYANDTSGNWCLGLPLSSAVTATVPGQPAVTRTTAYAVDTVACRITQQVIEPSTPASKVTASYGFDDCGNLNSLRVVGSSPDGTPLPARTTAFDYGSRCQLPESTTNALSEKTTYAWHYDFGVLTRQTDANGLSTTRSHDEFGRRTSEAAADGTRRTWTYDSCVVDTCWGASDLRFAVYGRIFGADGSLVREHHSFYDRFERVRRAEFHGARGAWLRQTYDYDILGRPVRESRPYSTAFNGQTVRTFDLLGRLTSQREYDATGVVASNAQLVYAGRKTTVFDALGRAQTRISDVAGRLRRVTDPAPGGTTLYDYDSFGNLVRIQDAGGAISSGNYDVRGFRKQWSDADAGTWLFTGNSFGELGTWMDAKGQSFSAGYDLLGRLVARTEPEGSSQWTWGASPAARNVGRLQSRSGPGFAEARTYDSLGRLSVRTITTDQGYRYDYTYNSIGAIDTLTYPTSPVPTGQGGSRFKVRYVYGFGAPWQIDDVTQPQARTLWKLTAVSDFDAPTQESLAGDVISRTSNYDAATQRLASQQAGTAGSASGRQNLSYQWDAAGNLLQRRDLNQGLAESFTYDNLDRVTWAGLSGAPDLVVAYDAAGNVTQKSGVGTYSYGDTLHPHAVTTAGSERFTYDRNGNLATHNGRTQAWTSFNLPKTLRRSGFEARFNYGPDRERWRQVATYPNGTETTHYAGSLLEKEATTSTGLTYWRHYVPTPGGATVVVSRNSNGSASTTYVLPDHLGSNDTLLDESGALVSKQSFDSYGLRRGGNWNSATAPDWLGIANTTRQAYTGHEALDNVGLVHMNGRVYDPRLARFLSADPLIGSLGDSQSVNPYAYVGNRPLNSTDPTGLCIDGCAAVMVAKFVVNAVFGSLFNNLLGSHRPPPPPATALPGWSAQSSVGLCGAGTLSPTCGGMILYAGGPTIGPGGPGTSTWSEAGVNDEYARENLERFFVDLGVNAVDVLILSPVHNAEEAVAAAARRDYATTFEYVAFTVCDIAKPCQSVLAPTKALRRVSKNLQPANSGGLNLYRAGQDGNRTRGATDKWQPGDWMLHLPNQGSVKANWKQNASRLRAEMSRQVPIFDSYRTAEGLQIPAGTTPRSPGRFLNAERKLLESHGWKYDTSTGAYRPPQQ